jgi:hypothetical protein
MIWFPALQWYVFCSEPNYKADKHTSDIRYMFIIYSTKLYMQS